MQNQYVILDFETTGLDAKTSEIIEIGAIRVQGLEEQARFHALVRPQGLIPQTVTHLTGITQEMVSCERSIEELAPELAGFLGDDPIVAHNSALEQDFLDHHVSPKLADGRVFEVHNSIEPLAMLLPDKASHSMESMRKWAGVDSGGRSHRADQDCQDLLAVLQHAHRWARENRMQVCRIVESLLGGRWWWSWFFATGGEPGPSTTAVTEWLARPTLGDLRGMQARDAAREIEWESAPGPAAVRPVLAAGAEGFELRESQVRMAELVATALASGSRMAVEAPTGTGKSVAYLLPGLETAEATQAPLVVATHSKALQDQLLEKDIPRVRDLLGHPGIRATTVKGQENYLCLRKLSDAVLTMDDETPLEERWGLAFLSALASVGVAMELDRVSQYLRMRFPSLGQWLEKVRSHHTTTLGPTCAFHGVCHFYDSARLAHLSDVVIANHALVFQWPAHLPQIRNVVFDEAHHLEEQITEAYSVRLSEQEVRDNLDRLSKRVGSRKSGDATTLARLLSELTLPAPFDSVEPGEQLARLQEDIRSRLHQLSGVAQLAASGFGEADSQYETLIELGRRKFPAREQLEESLKNLRGALEGLWKYLEAGLAAARRETPGYDLLATHAFRFESYARKVAALLGEGDEKTEHVRLIAWHPRERVWKFSVAPIDVSPLSEPFFASKRAVVLTSATLSAGISPTFVTDRIGLKLAQPPEILPSPYDLARQAVIHIPEDSGQPGTQAHFEGLVQFTEQAARILGGRTLLLMTANRRLKMAADILREKLKPHDILVFDSVSDRRAADGFRLASRALLIGSERYGEGLDIPGKALSLVIVEKINETMTRGPLAEARKARTRFGLYDYDFPLRMMWLKQRVGRLIRSPSDTGHVVVWDSRYHQWSVSSRGVVQRALAPMPVRGGRRDDVLRAIEASEAN